MSEEQKKRGRKYDQVIEGAREVFMNHGFEGASVDEIARAAGVSKATLYSYFPDKQRIFMEVLREKFQSNADSALEGFDTCCPPDKVLGHCAKILVDIFLTDFNLKAHRVMVGDAHRFPEMAREFYELGPLFVRKSISPHLRSAVERGELVIEDYDLAADQFLELCKAHLFPQYMLGVRSEFSEEEKSYVADQAAKTFLARYATA